MIFCEVILYPALITMLYTNLKHLESAADYQKALHENENVMVICGRMGPMCIPVYGVAEELEKRYPHVRFYDMESDNPESHVIRTLPEVSSLLGIPFTIYYRNGKVVQATSGIQTRDQIKSILDNEFAAAGGSTLADLASLSSLHGSKEKQPIPA
jgi:thioredoxin 1